MIDKVEGPRGIRASSEATPIRRTSRAAPVGASGFSKHLPAEEVEAAAYTGGIGALSGIVPALGLQEVDDALARAARGKARAKDILDRLDEIRLALLQGGLSVTRLQALARMVENRRGEVNDPRLAEILDEIDLRARVELAKLGY